MNLFGLPPHIRLIWSPVGFIAVTTLMALAASIYFLSNDCFIIFQNLFYFPIVIACMYYENKGLAYSVAISFLYFIVVIAFTRDSAVVVQALTRSFIFVGVAGVVAFLSAKHKQTELSLKASELKARALFDQTFQFIGMMTTDGTLIEANRAALTFSGIEVSSVLGKPFWETPWWTHSPELQEKVRQAVKKVAQGEFIRFEATHIATDGTLHYIDFSLKPVKDETGNVIFLIPEGRDITERKQVEDEVRKLNETLEVRIQERTAELARANQELETLIHIASHDMRSPLVNIQGYNHLLNKACDANIRILANTALPDGTRQALVASTATAATAMRFINAGVEKIIGLINGLLDLARLGHAPLTIQPLDMNALLQTVLNAMAFQIRTAAAEITMEALPACRSDATLLNQVFSNLLDNAIKYRDPARPLRVRVWGRRPGEGHREETRMVYCVEDNGLGVAPEHQQKIWNLFYQCNPQESGGGDGIGLVAVQRIVERQGGNVWLESELGKGSRFFLALPAAATAKEP